MVNLTEEQRQLLVQNLTNWSLSLCHTDCVLIDEEYLDKLNDVNDSEND